MCLLLFMKVPKIDWLDITAQFKQAAAQLDHGELIHDIHFSLFDAMSAIELADPKMDGMVQWRQFPKYPLSLKEAISCGYVRVDGHSNRMLIGVFDEILACIATWLEGHTLAQTIFTCLYLLDTSIVENLFLRAYATATVKVVEFIRKAIFQGWVCGEEDQQAVCLGFNMLGSVSDASVTTSLREARDKAMSLARARPSHGACDPSSVKAANWNKAELEALVTRVKFMRSLFAVTTSLGKKNREGIHNAQQELAQCLSHLDSIQSTLHLGEPLDPLDPIALGFHPLINQQLLPPSYKRYAILPRAKAMEFLKSVLQQVQLVFNIGRLDSLQDLVHAIMNLCAVDSPNVFARSLVVQLCIEGDREKLFGVRSLMALVREDVRTMYNPPSLNPKSPISSNQQVKETVDHFFYQAQAHLMEFLHVYCQHRARQRAEIAKYLESVGDLQQEAEGLDQLLHSLTAKFDPQRQHLACYSTWILYFISQLFIDYIHLGFEYNLFSPFENHYVFWYLEYAYGWQQTALKMSAKLLKQESQLAGRNKKKGKAKRRELPKEKELELSLLHVKRLICVGLMRAYEAFLLNNKIPRPSFEFASEELTFKNRFYPFAAINTPHPLTYQDYQRLAGISNYKGQNVNLFEASAQHFSTAKSALETVPQLEDFQSLMKVIKTNLVVMNLAASGHKKDSRTPPQLDFTVNKRFPIIRIN